MIRIYSFVLPAAMLAIGTAAAAQQTPMTRSEAVAAALDRGARVAVARADTAVAAAQLVAARVRPNPSVSASYSKSVPNYHYSFDIPFDFPYIRQLRIRSAQTGLDAANLRYTLARATIALDADTTYTRAVAARERLALSRRTAIGADSLRRMVERRRDAGDASDMDVELARVTAGQQANAAANDSLELISALLDLQAVLGMRTERVELAASDSLTAPPDATTPPSITLGEAAASLSLESATLSARLQRRSIWSTPSLSLGFEHGDPDQPGILPTFGLGIGLPLFDRNRGGIAQADAERARAVAELSLAQVEARNQIAHALHARENAVARVARDREVAASADRVAAMSLTAYREGAASLANVIEAVRASREVLAQYITDLAAAWIATAELRALSVATPADSTRNQGTDMRGLIR
jgi:cobalt-zinc-cadmium efflux system outer membrane protein